MSTGILRERKKKSTQHEWRFDAWPSPDHQIPLGALKNLWVWCVVWLPSPGTVEKLG